RLGRVRVGSTRRCLRGAMARANDRFQRLRLESLCELVAGARIGARWAEHITRATAPATLIFLGRRQGCAASINVAARACERGCCVSLCRNGRTGIFWDKRGYGSLV